MSRGSAAALAATLVVTLPAPVPARVPADGRTDLRTTTARVERDGETVRVHGAVAWRNAWRTDRNHDAVWVFVKLRVNDRAPWRHATIAEVRSSSPAVSCAPVADRVGAFCAASAPHRGDLATDVSIAVDLTRWTPRERAAPTLQAQVHGVEMVYVPAGSFSVGDPDPESIRHAAFYRSGAAGVADGPYRITSEEPILVAPEPGALYYAVRAAAYQGDRSGPIPAEFPKGTRAFYVMKYEISQGQYAGFLNAITDYAASFRAIHASPGYDEGRGSIRLSADGYVAGHPDSPANWVSWDDGLAFADWAGLRPMTEFEFTKAARGPGEPARGEHPWGTAAIDRLARRIGPDGLLVRAGAADEAGLRDETRDVLGASFYWVMELAGSLWERVVTPGHPRGRAFRGTHGDGELQLYGVPSNPDWPAGDHETGGYGYRGGGHYETSSPTLFQPMEWRDFGSWGGAPRSIAYGFRAARTAD